MTKKCKFDVEVTYNSDYFAEGEIRDTIKKAIKDLNDQKEKKFGRLKLCDPGKTNHKIKLMYKEELSQKAKPSNLHRRNRLRVERFDERIHLT